MVLMKQATRNNKVTRRGLGIKFLTRYARLVLWLLGVTDKNGYLVLINRIHSLIEKSGNKYATLYLKECVRLCHHWVAGRPTTCPQLDGSVRVATRRGLPLIIPGLLRLQMEGGDWVCVRVVLTYLSVFRIIKFPGVLKLSTITDPFKGISSVVAPIEVAVVWKRFTPFLPTVPVSSLGVERPLILKTAGPNDRISILGAPMDAAAWAAASEELRSAFRILSANLCPGLWEFLQSEMQVVAGHTFVRLPKLGKLSKKLEAAGKVRVFAIADVWTQTLLKPIHEWIFLLLKNIPQDGTFNQSGPLIKLADKLKERHLNGDSAWVASYDLSAATDRLPIDLQVQVMSQFLPREVAQAWKDVLVGRDWWLKDVAYRYSVGQPMGALSSWGMLALTHHFIVQMAAIRVGKSNWFEDYAVLGDDIVIADKAVAESYHYLMTTWLGVDINLSKSIVSDVGVMEFAKRIVGPWGEVSPLGPKNISGCLSNPGYLPQLLLDYIGKGGYLDWTVVEARLLALSESKDLLRVSKSGIDALIWTVLKPFGFIDYPGLTSRKDYVLADSQGEEMDPYLVLQAIDYAVSDIATKEQDVALEKTMASFMALKKAIKEKELVTPSLQYLLTDANRRVKDIARIVGTFQGPDYVAPEGKTLAEILRIKLDSLPLASPLDNCLVRRTVVKPRIRRLNFDFFKRVRKYTEMLQMY